MFKKGDIVNAEIVGVSGRLCDISIADGATIPNVPTSHRRDIYFSGMDAKVIFINQDSPQILSRGYQRTKTSYVPVPVWPPIPPTPPWTPGICTYYLNVSYQTIEYYDGAWIFLGYQLWFTHCIGYNAFSCIGSLPQTSWHTPAPGGWVHRGGGSVWGSSYTFTASCTLGVVAADYYYTYNTDNSIDNYVEVDIVANIPTIPADLPAYKIYSEAFGDQYYIDLWNSAYPGTFT